MAQNWRRAFSRFVGGIGRGWLSSLLGGRAIEKRVDENFPTWEEYAERSLSTTEKAQDKVPIDLPPHRIYVSSPLHGNFLFITLVIVALSLGYFSPELAPILVYGAIGSILVVCLFVIFRDGLYFHIEGVRLEADSEMINRDSRGPSREQEEEGIGFLRTFSKKNPRRKIFRSSLLQVHYQNVLRTFEQGNRRAWVDQDASIAELQILLSQRGMKLVWTMIEMLPQLGLLGTLIGLIRMFTAFRANITSPEVEVLAGFGTALGTTVLANIFVLILRPLYMRNERSMNETLATIQTLMATFILPTQQSVLERTHMAGLLAKSPPFATQIPAPAVPAQEEAHVSRSLGELIQALHAFTETHQAVESGAMARETAEIANEVKETLHAFHEAVDRNHLEKQQHAISSLTAAVEGLAGNLNHLERVTQPEDGASTARIEHDLMQLRMLTHDTLVLLEQIAAQMGGSRGKRLLTLDQTARAQAFPEQKQPRIPNRGAGRPRGEGEEDDAPGVHLFQEPI